MSGYNFKGAKFSPQGGGNFTKGSNAGFRNNYGAGYSNNGPVNYQPKKRNGCKKFIGRNDKSYIGGWFVDKYAGLVKVLVFGTKHSDTVHTGEKNGREWVSMAAKVTYMNTGQVATHSALLDVQTGRVTIKDLNIGLNPNKNWCGFYFKAKN